MKNGNTILKLIIFSLLYADDLQENLGIKGKYQEMLQQKKF